jgi:hypothetical protein
MGMLNVQTHGFRVGRDSRLDQSHTAVVMDRHITIVGRRHRQPSKKVRAHLRNMRTKKREKLDHLSHVTKILSQVHPAVDQTLVAEAAAACADVALGAAEDVGIGVLQAASQWEDLVALPTCSKNKFSAKRPTKRRASFSLPKWTYSMLPKHS